MKYRRKKAFTVIELTVTLAILAISFSLSAVVVVSLNSTQQHTNEIITINNEIQNASDFIEEFVSFISLDDPTNKVKCNDQNVKFYHNSSIYTLGFSENVLSAKTENYSGIVEYFDYNKSISLQNITSIQFSYNLGDNGEPDLLVASFTTIKNTERHIYLVRVNYESLD